MRWTYASKCSIVDPVAKAWPPPRRQGVRHLRANRGFMFKLKAFAGRPRGLGRNARTWARSGVNVRTADRTAGRRSGAGGEQTSGCGFLPTWVAASVGCHIGSTADTDRRRAGIHRAIGKVPPTAPSSSFDKERDETDELKRRPQSSCCAAGREIHLGTSSGRTCPAGEILCANLLVRRVRERVWCHGANGAFGSSCQTISRNRSSISRPSTNEQDFPGRSWKGLLSCTTRFDSDTQLRGLNLWGFV
jgi:hypothetical protein